MGALADIAYAADPALIMESAGMVPDAWQAEFLRRRGHREMLLCGRQLGKSQTVAAAAIDEIRIRKDARILAVCPAERQSKFLIRLVKDLHNQLFGPPQEESTTHLVFPNGGEMWAVPSNEANIRGYAAITLLIIDEASRVPDDLYNAVRPMLLVSQGRCFILSTPFGKRGFFHKEWTEGVGWHRTMIRADQVPRISKEYLEAERRAVPDAWFRQEYMCEFAETDGAVFAYDDVMRALTDDVRPLFPVEVGNAEVRPLFQ